MKLFVRTAAAAFLLAAIVALTTQAGSVMASSHDPAAPEAPNNSIDSLPEAENSVFDGDLGFPRVSASQGQLTNVLGVVFMLAGALASVFIVVGGLRYVIAAGNPEGVQKAKNTVLYAVVGLVISIFAFTIVNFVISNV